MQHTDEVDTVILGAGISGLVAAKILDEGRNNRVLVLDEYDWIGGNHISCDFGPFTFDVGTFIFEGDSPLMRYFPELLPLYHPISWSISRIAPDNAVRSYPISIKEEVFGIGPLRTLMLFGSIAWDRCSFAPFESADDYARYWIGSYLYEHSGLAHYIQRFYGLPATAIDPVFAEKRMGWLAEGASLRKRITKMLKYSNNWEFKQFFARPRGGFGELYSAARQTLEQKGVCFALGANIRSVTRKGALFHITTDCLDLVCHRLISTIPVNRMFELCCLGNQDPLPSSKLVSLFFSFSGDRGFSTSVLYNFAEHGNWKRLTMFSDYYGLAEGREYFGIEMTSHEDSRDSPAEAAASFRADIQAKGLFKGSLTLVGSHELTHAYPIYAHGAMARANRMISVLRAFGVESMGRQGGFDYLPSTRRVTLAIEKAMDGRIEPPINVRPTAT